MNKSLSAIRLIYFANAGLFLLFIFFMWVKAGAFDQDLRFFRTITLLDEYLYPALIIFVVSIVMLLCGLSLTTKNKLLHYTPYLTLPFIIYDYRGYYGPEALIIPFPLVLLFTYHIKLFFRKQ